MYGTWTLETGTFSSFVLLIAAVVIAVEVTVAFAVKVTR